MASKPPARKMTVAEGKQKWQEFVLGSGLKNVGLQKYYLGKAGRLARWEYERLATEMFRDATNIGAIIIPEPHQAEDFQFKIWMHAASNGQKLRMFLKSKPEKQKALYDYAFYLDQSATLVSPTVYSYIECFQQNIDMLCK